jgi:signal transduction histidine kinase
MRERIQQFHGTMNIEANDRGTTILATIPIPQVQLSEKGKTNQLQATI